MDFQQILFLQAAGIGDILFTQKIVHKLAEKYQKPIYWPIAEPIYWITEYIKSPAQFILYDENKHNNSLKHIRFPEIHQIPEYPGKTLVIPVHCADAPIFQVPIMPSKYKMCNLDYTDWQKYIQIERNYSREEKLYKEIVGDKKDYIYVNKLYATPPWEKESKYVNVPDYPNIIFHKMTSDYTFFDWLKIAENAKEIHTVSTGNFYLYEANKGSMPDIHIYNRDDDHNLKQLAFAKPHLNKNWIFHE
jgi:hypothetical protein